MTAESAGDSPIDPRTPTDDVREEQEKRSRRDRELFDTIAARYLEKDLLPASSRARKQRLLASLRGLSELPDRRILELGCGAGFTARYLSGRYARYVGVDYSRELIELGRAHHRGDSRVELIWRDVHDLELAESFDLVLLIGVLHHDRAPAALLERASRRLVAGGCLVANEPQPANPLIRAARALRKRLDSDYSSEQAQLSAATLEALLRGAGLERVTVRSQGLFSTPFAEVAIRSRPLQALATPIAALACRVDRLFERYSAGVLRHLSWNLAARGFKPGAPPAPATKASRP